jgi:hypothetical protein
VKIWKLEGTDLATLHAALVDKPDAPVYRIRFADDGSGLKVKVNEGMWSLGIGTLEVTQ